MDAGVPPGDLLSVTLARYPPRRDAPILTGLFVHAVDLGASRLVSAAWAERHWRDAMRLSPFNVFTVFVAGAVWVLMFGYWILFCISVFPWVHAVSQMLANR